MGLLDVEFNAGGLIIYGFALVLFLIPFMVWAAEDIQRKRQPKGGPAADTSLPPQAPTKVTDLYIYPIKSCRGIKLKEANLFKTGLDLDRQWMFVDADKLDFLTIRQNSDMTLINTEITDDDFLKVSVSGKGSELSFKIPAHPTKGWLNANTTLGRVTIWGLTVDGHIYSEDLTEPFTEFFGRKVRLVLKGPTPRPLRGNAAPEVLGRKETTKFADVMPVQISNQKSIDELNFRLKQDGHEPITIERFRPNIVIEGAEPWYEDSWKTVKVNDKEDASITLDVAARCARCQVPNVDPDTAVKDKKQPVSLPHRHQVVQTIS